MAKSKKYYVPNLHIRSPAYRFFLSSHTNHNQTRKAHRNGIKRPTSNRSRSLKGVRDHTFVSLFSCWLVFLLGWCQGPLLLLRTRHSYILIFKSPSSVATPVTPMLDRYIPIFLMQGYCLIILFQNKARLEAKQAASWFMETRPEVLWLLLFRTQKFYAFIMLSILAPEFRIDRREHEQLYIFYRYIIRHDSLPWALKRFDTAIQCGSQSHSLWTFCELQNTDMLFELTAASSGRRAPFAILCFPALNFVLRLVMAALIDPSPATSKARHSSSLAGWPSRREKNLCLNTALICSNVCVEYHPSRSCLKG